MSILGPDPRATSAATDGQPLNQQSPAAAKIARFRLLFRGREDVYPRRFESRRTGKSGYAPACANEWVQGISDKHKFVWSEAVYGRVSCRVGDDTTRRRTMLTAVTEIRWPLRSISL